MLNLINAEAERTVIAAMLDSVCRWPWRLSRLCRLMTLPT